MNIDLSIYVSKSGLFFIESGMEEISLPYNPLYIYIKNKKYS